MAPKRKHAGGPAQPARHRAVLPIAAAKSTGTGAAIARNPLGFLLGPEQAWLVATDANRRAALADRNVRCTI